MNLVVLLKLTPDTVEELEIAGDGRSLDQDSLRFRLSDPDEHAIEEALLLKERHGGEVTVVVLEAPEAEDVLFTALAKGATRAVKIAGDWTGLRSVEAAQVLAGVLAPDGALAPDTLVLVRSQASDEVAGELGSFLAERFGLPYLSVVTSVTVAGEKLTAIKEFAGGLRGEFTLPLPAILGIQSAEKPPRYVAIAKVRQTQKTAKIETVAASVPETPPGGGIERLYKPQPTARAQMWEGSAEEIAERMVDVLAEKSLV